VSSAGSWTRQGSLFAANRGDGVLSNCGTPAGAGNPGTWRTARAAGSPAARLANIGLATALSDRGGHTDVLTIPAGSPAKRFDNPCSTGADQRLAPRSPGGACDAGAFEEGATAPPISGFAFPVPTAHARGGQDGGGARGRWARCACACPAPASSLSSPVTQGVPVGSTLDTKHGNVGAHGPAEAGAAGPRATVLRRRLELTQSRKTTNLTLNEALATCPKRGKASRRRKKKPKTRKLVGQGSGSFRTSGRYSAATVRGTKWLVQDTCAGTLTRVAQGVVAVRDNVRHKTILVRAGHRYLAKPKR